ncbi:MAG: Gfo/Idh/MocA family protein [Bryobacteraceae bacterium]
MTTIRIGIIGAGAASHAIHIPGFRRCEGVELAAVCDPDPAASAATGITPAYTGYRELLEGAVDAVVIAAPNHLHHEIALAAVERGRHVLCEKPLALNLAQAREMLDAADRAGVVHMTAFTYHYTPAFRWLHHLAGTDALGKLRTVRAAYLMALSGHLLGWRSRREYAGSGVLADIGSHLIHLVQLAAGPVESLAAMKRRFREDPSSDVEDWIAFLAKFENGACGTFEISRVCPGRGAAITEEMFIELYGDAGSAVMSMQDPWALYLAIGEAGRDPSRALERVTVPAELLKIDGSPRDVHDGDPRWSYRFDQAFQFAGSIRLGRSRVPSFAEGVRCQAVLDAALAASDSGGWTAVAR